eukprot:CFRG8138T1
MLTPAPVKRALEELVADTHQPAESMQQQPTQPKNKKVKKNSIKKKQSAKSTPKKKTAKKHKATPKSKASKKKSAQGQAYTTQATAKVEPLTTLTSSSSEPSVVEESAPASTVVATTLSSPQKRSPEPKRKATVNKSKMPSKQKSGKQQPSKTSHVKKKAFISKQKASKKTSKKTKVGKHKETIPDVLATPVTSKDKEVSTSAPDSLDITTILISEIRKLNDRVEHAETRAQQLERQLKDTFAIFQDQTRKLERFQNTSVPILSLNNGSSYAIHRLDKLQLEALKVEDTERVLDVLRRGNAQAEFVNTEDSNTSLDRWMMDTMKYSPMFARMFNIR